ncbi:oxygen-independent coproporphyrinogen III oxidase [Mesonia aestuariivivens]|uniref:Coproporphyrinogen-III oxidase n=1 Tax=Mesonia aestuariivivens TaxID=2796128 RepID=A0ABS6W2H9_9FLAO|nr:oxygen-independent coproporphyrinogen III oxidase [Mesonia aestuariivivens]MBW2962061.1 oxygen-independent coproporphyrinogen III oxidase [Mesonia aestuariivivens]
MCQPLIQKYNIPGPRYTSYPTVPYWDSNTFSARQWKKSVLNSFEETNISEGISLYIHLPYCESMCTFCGCNKRITKRHEVEEPYITSVLKEWQLYLDFLPNRPLIKEIHLGGGTPTFFSPENLQQLIKGILKHAELANNYQFSFEGHPNNTTKAHLEALYEVGFRRVSYGVQDYDVKVQQAIHRIQPFEKVEKATQLAREIGYTSISHDIIFGLPFQSIDAVENTILKTKALMPDRIAFYSYAHVPWIKGNGQRGYSEQHLPSAETKRTQYQLGKELLEEMGYVEIGMDHFGLKTDELYQSLKTNNLHRNFMGYSASKTQLMIGLGVSAISDSWYGFAQNSKSIEEYQEMVGRGDLPVFRGHVLNDEDLMIRKHILNLMCHLQTDLNEENRFFELPETLHRLQEMEKDGLIKINPDSLQITEKGRPFVRNICMAFDLRLQRKKPETRLFSMTV